MYNNNNNYLTSGQSLEHMVNDFQFNHTRSSIWQSAWNKPVVADDLAAVKSHFCDSFNTARLLAVLAPHSDDCLHALPLATCGLKLDDEVIMIAVGHRLGVNLCEPHQCPCGKLVDARGTHGLSCKHGAARAIRHHQLNDIVRPALVRANMPSVLERSGLSWGDGKRPDGMKKNHPNGKAGNMSPGTSPSPSPTLSPIPTYISLRRVRAARQNGGGQQKGNQVRISRPLVHLHLASYRNLRTNQR